MFNLFNLFNFVEVVLQLCLCQNPESLCFRINHTKFHIFLCHLSLETLLQSEESCVNSIFNLHLVVIPGRGVRKNRDKQIIKRRRGRKEKEGKGDEREQRNREKESKRGKDL